MSVLERLSELLPALPPGLIEAWGQLVLFAVPVCLYLAAVVLPFVVLYGLIRAHFGRRSLLERCSRQQARFANFLNWLFLVCFVGLGLSKVVPYETFPPLYQAGLYLSAGLLLGGTIIWTVVVAAWKPLRGWPVLHGFLAFLTGSSLACLPIIGLILGRVALQGTELPQENDLQTLLALLLPSASDPFWLYFGLIHFLEVASAGAVLASRPAEDRRFRARLLRLRGQLVRRVGRVGRLVLSDHGGRAVLHAANAGSADA